MRSLSLAVAAACVLTASTAAAQVRSFDPSSTYNVPIGNSHARGDAEALVTIVEFSDFGCQYCRRAQATLERLEHLYPHRLRRVFRHNPLDLEDAGLAAEASMAAGAQGQFWPMHDRLFADGGYVTREMAEAHARELGLDLARFRQDLDEHAHVAQILEDQRAAAELGVYSTPYFFVNGRPVRGSQPLAVFVYLIEEELERAQALVDGGVEPIDVYATRIENAKSVGEPGRTEYPYDRTELDPTSVYEVGLGLPGHSDGPDDALVTLVAFSDFECPYCDEVRPQLTRLREELGDDVRIVFRHLPLGFHASAQLAAEAAVAAAEQDKFWPFHDVLFAHQDALSRADLETYAEQVGLDMKKFRAALDDRRHHDAVVADAASGGSIGVQGTPTVFINGMPIVGTVPYDYMKMRVQVAIDLGNQLIESGIARADVYAAMLTGAGVSEAGDPSRMPVGRVELDRDGYEAAVSSACRARDGSRAAELFDELDADGKERARVDCTTFGVDLP